MKSIEVKQLEISEDSNKDIYFSIIESLLFVSGEPLKIDELADILECSPDFSKELLYELTERYNNEDRGLKLIYVQDSVQLVTKPANSQYIQKLLKTNVRQSLSHAALETLAIIAYKQPITRIGIDEIRGVKSDRAVMTLLEKRLIKDVGRLEVPGRPILYGTTDEFLKHFGLEGLGRLPNIDEIADKSQENKE